jgi:hypothetical protein
MVREVVEEGTDDEAGRTVGEEDNGTADEAGVVRKADEDGVEDMAGAGRTAEEDAAAGRVVGAEEEMGDAAGAGAGFKGWFSWRGPLL